MLRQEPHFRPRLAWLALAAAAAIAVPAAMAAGGPSVGALQQRDRALAARSRSAVLGLYALQSRLTRAEARLGRYRRDAAELRRERALVAAQLTVARHGVTISQRRLAERVRALYEQGNVDPLAVILGAESLDAAMTTLDGLKQLANGDQEVLRQVRGARASLGGLQTRLVQRQQRLDAVVAAATATAQSLARAESERRSYITGLAAQRRLTRSAIARLEDEARAAQEKAQTLEAATAAPTGQVLQVAAPTDTTAPAGPATTTDAAAPAPAVDAGAQTLTVTATGYALPGHTATGLPVGWGVAAVDPSVIPLGTRFSVPGYGEAVAADIGGAVRGTTIDLWFPSVGQAAGWGRRTVTITLH